MMTPEQAETLGGVVRTILMLLAGALPDVGRTTRMELLVPMGFCDGKSVQHGEAYILPATLAVQGELLRVDDRFILDEATRNIFRLFLRSVFEPPVVGGGKFNIAEREDGIVFMPKEHGDDGRILHHASLCGAANVRNDAHERAL